MNLKFVSGIVIFVCIIISPLSSVYASTTIDETKWCRYTDSKGRVVFDGNCSVNWGTLRADGCPNSSNIPSRYIITFTPHSKVVIYTQCDGTVIVNDKKGILLKGMHNGKETIKIVTEESERFEFEPVYDSLPDEKSEMEIADSRESYKDKDKSNENLPINSAELKHQDTRLNIAYEKIMGEISSDRRKQLRDIQRLWIKYRDAKCGFYISSTESETLDVSAANQCILSTTALRVKELEDIEQIRYINAPDSNSINRNYDTDSKINLVDNELDKVLPNDKSHEQDSYKRGAVLYKYEKPLNLCYKKNEMMVKKLSMVMRPFAKDKSEYSEKEKIKATKKLREQCRCTYMDIAANADVDLEDDLIDDLIKYESSLIDRGYLLAPAMNKWEHKQWIDSLSLSLGETVIMVHSLSAINCSQESQ